MSTTVPPSMVRANLEAERDAARAWAGRHNWSLRWLLDDLVLRAATYHLAAKRLVELRVRCDSYRALPSVWDFVRPGTDETGRPYCPSAGPRSIFHGKGIICAPWNRGAYVELGGPHGDWSGPSSWLQVGGAVSVAKSIPDMLAVLDSHLRQSPGMMT